jgi:hypothetical protein
MIQNYGDYIFSDSTEETYYPRFLEPWLGDFGWHKRLPWYGTFTSKDKVLDKKIKPIKKVIAIKGENRVGKDWLAYRLKEENDIFAPLGLADLLKCRICKDLIHSWGLTAKDSVDLIFHDREIKGFDKEKVRELYKFYGELSKSIHGKTFWVDHTLNRCLLFINKDKIPIITDLRFPEEEKILQPWLKETIILKEKGDNEKYLLSGTWKNLLT